ncbi:hypothetical protein [Bauldia litoralis]|uniref:Uncharacterized protein n=1 Tax=Bauldia litoralis TaxID=665467 RepID=A0A1G6E3J3_9HYPH|nr:hypothetical protein [Bauldia litoralis]SDB51983.1 hypothetical protein SAMN02982931_04058 [Bauldia litoralis]
MEYLKAYLSAVGGRLFLLPSVISGIVGLLGILKGLGVGFLPEITAPWLILLAFSIVAAWSIAGLLNKVVTLQRQVASSLKIDFEDREPWVSQIENSNIPTPADPHNKGPSRWYRVRIFNLRPDKSAKNCRVRLAKIEYSQDGTDFAESAASLPQKLRWSNSQDFYESIDVAALEPRFVDVISVDPTHNRLFLKTPPDEAWLVDNGLTDRVGIYRLTIVAVADEGVGATCTLRVKWSGHWDETKVELEE